ncbi:amidohydrolase [Ornithinicoccus halotolerans]|uniref:amidohydrolase n=1 Tax=Ornithinicoccus halotolerans TaxID=1748220 RepID=UPI001296B1C0|nr:amidohydrolase family protein [Ornithinicoccus halotolerans]
MSDILLRRVRVVDLDGDGVDADAPAPVDVLVTDGRVSAVAPVLRAPASVPVVDGEGRWVLPGLWDQHVHVVQWALTRTRLDVSGSGSAAEVARRVGDHLADRPQRRSAGLLVGWGYRSAGWAERPAVAALDAVTGPVPVALISGDGHNGWLNSAALRLFGLPPRDGALDEEEWFGLYARIEEHTGGESTEQAVTEAVDAALRRGVVGLVDLEFARPWEQWQHRHSRGVGPIRVRAGVYPDGVDDVIAEGLRTGDPLEGTGGLATMGPLKVICDGSLNTRTAWCCEPYADGDGLALPAGAPNLDPGELADVVGRAHRHGLQSALHAIGDRALAAVLDAFETTGARGSVEHAQLLRWEDLPRWRRLPVRASVQPAHLLDDRVVTEQCWPDRAERSFVLRGLLEHGIEVALGSDAPVAPLDPWLAIAAAVHRGEPGDPAWYPEQALTPREALRASVDGHRVTVGAPGDLVLLDDDPLVPGAADTGEQARRLRSVRTAVTVVAGRVAAGDLGAVAGD